MRIDPTALVASLSSLADTQPQYDLAGTLQQVVDAAKLLFRASGAGVMLADEQGQLRWVSATDQNSQLAEDNQELLGQGPCMVAFSQRAPAMIRDARAEPDWGEISLLFSDVEIRAAAAPRSSWPGVPSAPWTSTRPNRGTGTRARSAPSKPTPGWSPACSARPPRRRSRVGWPSSSRSPSPVAC
jgi:hypothetical protein